MDDTRTQQALDELADLFLTGQGPVADTQAPSAPPVSPTPPSGPTRDELVGPAPIRLRPKLTEKPKHAPPAPPTPLAPAIEGNAPLRLHPEPEPDDSPLASIGEVEPHDDNSQQDFTQEDLDAAFNDAPDPPAATTTPPAQEVSDQTVAVEAVILGNLPGLSGPWLTQYAQLLAQEEGPVAILHVDDDLIDLELVEPTNRDTTSRGVSLRMPPGGGKIDPRSVLEALLDSTDSPDSADSAPQTVLVHLDPQHDEQGLARALAIDDWTLMCGADDLAIIAGYKMLKAMVEDEPAVAQKRIGLMVMGSDPKVSQGAAHKFQAASESFLHMPVQLLGWQKQMVPVNLRHLGRFEDVDAVWPRLAQWFDLFAGSEPQADIQSVTSEPTGPAIQEPALAWAPPVYIVPPIVPSPVLEPGEPTILVEETVAPVQPPRPRPSKLFTELAEIAAKPRRMAPPTPPVTPIPPATPEPRPVVEAPPVAAHRPAAQPVSQAPPAQVSTPAPKPQAQPASPTTNEPNLVDLLMAGTGAVPGGIALEARCPHQSQTQLMLGQDGRLHLLCRHDSEGFDSLQAAMIDLLQASHWVREHLDLLALTQRQCRFDVDSKPVLHLFTDRADWATTLIARLGEALKLHLLQEVRVGEESAWFCTPLN